MEKVDEFGGRASLVTRKYRISDYSKRKFFAGDVFWKLDYVTTTFSEYQWGVGFRYSPLTWGDGSVTALDFMRYSDAHWNYGDFSVGLRYITSLGCIPGHDWSSEYWTDPTGSPVGYAPWAHAWIGESAGDSGGKLWYIDLSFVCPAGVEPRVSFS